MSSSTSVKTTFPTLYSLLRFGPWGLPKAENALARAYSFLQQVVGIIAVALPFAVALGDWAIDDHDLRRSISSYYYGRTGNYFVGSLCALGVFFLSYQHDPLPGHKSDNRMSIAAAIFAIGVALLPTPSNGGHATGGAKTAGVLHLSCAAILFTLVGVFSLYQFTKTDGEITARRTWKDKLRRVFRSPPEDRANMTDRKQWRNLLYRTGGWIIFAAIGVIVLSNVFHWNLLFWMESLAVCSFGVSWLVKGGFRGILADHEGVPPVHVVDDVVLDLRSR